MCNGCTQVKGNPFWGECQTYSCAKNQGVEHCGLCQDFPCKEYMSRYDPREGPASALMRAGLLAYRAKYGEKKALELLEEVEASQNKVKPA